MKTVDSGYGNSSDLMHARELVWEKKPFRYITITTSGGSGAVGGGFRYEIRGTNDMRELLEPNVMRDAGQIFDTKTGKGIKKTNLAKEYMKSLSKTSREALIDELLEKFLTDSLA